MSPWEPAQHNLPSSLHLGDMEPPYRVRTWITWPASWASELQSWSYMLLSHWLSDQTLLVLLPGLNGPCCHRGFWHPVTWWSCLPADSVPGILASGAWRGQHNPSKTEVFSKHAVFFHMVNSSISQICNLTCSTNLPNTYYCKAVSAESPTDKALPSPSENFCITNGPQWVEVSPVHQGHVMEPKQIIPMSYSHSELHSFQRAITYILIFMILSQILIR